MGDEIMGSIPGASALGAYVAFLAHETGDEA